MAHCAASDEETRFVIVPPDFAALRQRERERDLARERLVRAAACYRSCCHPTRLDRVSRALRLAPASC
jgi:hypothetical protein